MKGPCFFKKSSRNSPKGKLCRSSEKSLGGKVNSLRGLLGGFFGWGMHGSSGGNGGSG